VVDVTVPVVPPAEVISQEDIVEQVMSYEPNTIGPLELTSYQFSTPLGSVFGYHPIVSTDMGALDQLRLGADSYTLSGGQLQLIGHDGLLQFFQEFDQKRKQGASF